MFWCESLALQWTLALASTERSLHVWYALWYKAVRPISYRRETTMKKCYAPSDTHCSCLEGVRIYHALTRPLQAVSLKSEERKRMRKDACICVSSCVNNGCSLSYDSVYEIRTTTI